MTTPLSQIQSLLAEIKERASNCYGNQIAKERQLIRTDIPMLVARVEALMDTLVEMETEDDIYARRSIRNAALTETLAMMKGTKK